MVEFHLTAALVAALVATVVMSAMMTMAKAAGMTDMPPMPLVMGSMMSGDRGRAMTLGSMAHFLVMGTVVFGIGYALVFAALDNDSWWVGALVGFAHGLVVVGVHADDVHDAPPHDQRTRGGTRAATNCGR